MNRFWNLVLRPLIEAVDVGCLVEVGVAGGLLTGRVLDYCASADAVLHAIDPMPQINVEEWQERYGDRLNFHQARSLEVLGEIRDVDVTLIDGDHNWFTVYHELMLLEETALKAGCVPPLVALHDVDWPYGRRDMYYDPDGIPETHRRPHLMVGLVPGETELSDRGINWDMNNAVEEGSPRNGVRTAIEDFAGQSNLDWEISYVPGFHGLGIMVTKERLEGNDRLDRTIKGLHAAKFLDTWARELEWGRIGAEIEANRSLARQRKLPEQGELDRLREQIVDAERRLSEVPDLRLRIADLEYEVDRTRRAADSAADNARQLDERVMRGEQVLVDVFSSPSWRLTKPLRTVKAKLRG